MRTVSGAAFILQGVEDIPGLRADDSVNAEVEVLLQLPHRRFGLGAKASVDPPVSKPTALILLCRRRTGRPVAPRTFTTGWLWLASSMFPHVTRPTTPSTGISSAC